MKTSNAFTGLVLCVTLALVASTSPAQMRSGKLGVGVGGSAYLFNDNIKDNLIKGGGGLTLSYSAMEHLGLRVAVGAGQLGWRDLSPGYSYTTSVFSGDVKVSYDILPHSKINPFLYVGGGVLYLDPRRDVDGMYLGTSIEKFDVNYLGGGGIDFFFNEFVSLTLSGDFVMTNTNNLDLKKNSNNESYSRINLEVRYYFFDQNYITKLLKALEERYSKK